MRAFLRILVAPLKTVAWALVILAPALGVWLASSLAAFHNGPVWLVCAAGMLLFPVLPLAWDIWASRRFERRQTANEASGQARRPRHLGFSDRLILRTFLLNLTFVGTLLAVAPQAGFTALATRGDWFLDHWQSPRAEVVRPVVFAAAERLEWVYELSKDNPYERFQDETPRPAPTPDQYGDAETRAAVDPLPSPEEPAEQTPPARIGAGPPPWPMKAELHPLIASMPADVKSSYQAVAQYIAANEDDPFLRVKALNDFVADRVAYDVPALRAGVFPPQDANTVFERKTAVCAGYARLMVAMAEVTGDEVVYVVGVSRDDSGGIAGGGHAWNAAKIQGKWYLIDTTWNAGYVEADTFKRSYRTDYLFTPPEIFGSDHLPDDESWQLRSDVISRGEFIRAPMLSPEFYAQGLRLLAPQRSQIETTSKSVEIRVENPRRVKVFARIAPRSGVVLAECQTRGVREVKIECPVQAGTTSMVQIFAGAPRLTTFPRVGRFEVVSR